MQKITPFLWFDTQAEEAANFYVSVFNDSKILKIVRNGPGSPAPEGSALTVSFQLEGQEFVALNGGPVFQFNPAISLVVNCITQNEVDSLWHRLSEGGSAQQCGWLQDKYGISWQIVPVILPELLNHPDPAKAQRVMAAMLKMIKLDIEILRNA